MEDITTGVRTALKSWLSFGASLTGTKPKRSTTPRRHSSSRQNINVNMVVEFPGH